MVFCICKKQKDRDKLEREREINWTAMVLSRTADYRLACWATDHGVDAGSRPEPGGKKQHSATYDVRCLSQFIAFYSNHQRK